MSNDEAEFLRMGLRVLRVDYQRLEAVVLKAGGWRCDFCECVQSVHTTWSRRTGGRMCPRCRNALEPKIRTAHERAVCTDTMSKQPLPPARPVPTRGQLGFEFCGPLPHTATPGCCGEKPPRGGKR